MSNLKFDAQNTPYIPLGELTIRLENDPLTDAEKEKARRELRETPDVMEPAIVQLRALIKGKKCARDWIIAIMH